jgi:hypothetical protein
MHEMKYTSPKIRLTRQRLKGVENWKFWRKPIVLKKQAFTIEGKTLMPEFRIAMTHAELFALPVPVRRSGASLGQIIPRIYDI